ncbi:MAG TPA: hypothetical protein GX710_05045 [Clostridiales bacterium]|nr:hypothetical protein [Clostridiales bacterium]
MTDKYGYYMEKKSELILAEAAEKIKRGQSALLVDSDGLVQKYTQESYDELCRLFEEEKPKRLVRYAQFYNNHEWLTEAHEELERRKVANTDILKSYGLDI